MKTILREWILCVFSRTLHKDDTIVRPLSPLDNTTEKKTDMQQTGPKYMPLDYVPRELSLLLNTAVVIPLICINFVA